MLSQDVSLPPPPPVVAPFVPNMNSDLAARMRQFHKNRRPSRDLSQKTGPKPTRPKHAMNLSDVYGASTRSSPAVPSLQRQSSSLSDYSDVVDIQNESLRLGEATVHGAGVDFASGKRFRLSLNDLVRTGELGKGHYGSVYRVRHTRPPFRSAGQGLATTFSVSMDGQRKLPDDFPGSSATIADTGMVMAMKEMRLELDNAKLRTIVMELNVLHRCTSPYIVEFYGAFFQEGAVYVCMEYMDGGSIEKLYGHGDGIPEPVLQKITRATVQGLHYLKEEHKMIHRDIKPSNILVNTRGEIKICDFGVSGNLVASMAKTHIGSQPYMAPERISSGDGLAPVAGGAAGSYRASSDVWSLGLSIVECALGRYPYPPDTYDTIFSQLAAIVDGPPPDLPHDRFSSDAHAFVAGCLHKLPGQRLTYPQLLQHAWLAHHPDPPGPDADMPDAHAPAALADALVARWVVAALERRVHAKVKAGLESALQAGLRSVGPAGRL